jgi:ferredoxin
MRKIITEQNLSALLESLIKEGKRVVAPRMQAGTPLYGPIGGPEEMTLGQMPRRSAKETFFPVCEDILRYEKEGAQVRVEDVDTAAFPDTVLVGVRPCDAAAIPTLDAVFSWDYNDAFFLERRRKTTVVGIACTAGDDACFCTAVGLSPSETRGSDLFLTPLTGGGYAFDVCSEKGEALVVSHPALFADGSDAEPLAPAAPSVGPIDLGKVKAWLDGHFEDPYWEGVATRCAGCGVCAYVCPACHCFDIVDEGTARKGSRRKCWDACGFWKFTHHASGHNPRDAQPKRYRNRIMHKFKYYQDKFGQTLCTGCGRCIRACPVGVDIADVVAEIEKK